MEATVLVCLVTAIACALLTLDGAGENEARAALPLVTTTNNLLTSCV